MRMLSVAAGLWLGFTVAAAAGGQTIDPAIAAGVDRHYPALETLYKHLHANPELSFQERQTAARLAEEMKLAGYDVTGSIGGHGVVALLRNGQGPTVMVRCDMDALPIVEQTELPYASKVRVADPSGDGQVGVMHACGHDMHMACWVGTARVLADMKNRWAGTLIFIAQPAEERGAGARAMLADGLYDKFGKPDYALALHVDSSLPVGMIGYTEGWAMANVDSVTITVKGKGGHGAAPHAAIDPIVIAARIVLDLQTIVSREVDPIDSAVVTVGSIHGGTKHNIIPSEVTMQLTVRSYKDETREHVLNAIERIAKAASQAAAAPEPSIVSDRDEYTPALYNAPELTRRTVTALRKVFGESNVVMLPPVMGGEDFAQYRRAGVDQAMMFRLGTVDPQQLRAVGGDRRKLPSVHSPFYYPVLEPSLRNGVKAMSAAVMNLMSK